MVEIMIALTESGDRCDERIARGSLIGISEIAPIVSKAINAKSTVHDNYFA